MSAPAWPLSLQILREACDATGDRFEPADQDTNHLARVSRGERFFFAAAGFGPLYPLNPAFVAALADDKHQMSAVLAAADIATVPTRCFFADAADAARYAGPSPADARAYAQAAGYPLFAKLNRGAQGRLATRLASEDDLLAYLREARAHDRRFLLQPVIDEPEARVFVLDGRVRFLYRRERLAIRGDGAQSYAALLAAHVADPRFAEEPSALASMADTLARLARAKRALGDVPPAGETVFAADAANLSQGGRLADLSLAPPDALHAWAARVGAATGLRIFGADVFCAGALDEPAGWRVIEINANPSLNGLWRAGERDACLGVWRDVLENWLGAG